MNSKETIDFAGKTYDKMKRYGWDVSNSLPLYRLVNKEDLNIDRTYQRPIVKNKIGQMRRTWDWIACGALLVFETDNGTMYIVDGQHRHEAAMALSEIDKLPCLIWRTKNKSSSFAASEFIIANTMKTGLKATELFKAKIAAGDVTAQALSKLIEDSGYSVKDSSSKSLAIKCVGCLYRHMKDNETILRKIWQLCLNIHSLEVSERESIDKRIVDGMMYLEKTIMQNGLSITDSDLAEKLIIAGKRGCLRSIANEVAAFAKGGERQCAIGLLNIINFKKKNKIALM